MANLAYLSMPYLKMRKIQSSMNLHLGGSLCNKQEWIGISPIQERTGCVLGVVAQH